jgi:hypothetical protein
MDTRWRDIINTELGFSGAGETDPPPASGRLRLRPERIARIRRESDDVRELLRIDDAGGGTPPETAPSGPEPAVGDQPDTVSGAAPDSKADWKADNQSGILPAAPGLAEFLAGLGAAETEILRLIAGAGDPPAPDALRTSLAECARTFSAMPELLIDGINEQFQGYFGDLLIDTLDGVPVILAEYKAEILQHFGAAQRQCGEA